jgi:hypothetical protein
VSDIRFSPNLVFEHKSLKERFWAKSSERKSRWIVSRFAVMATARELREKAAQLRRTALLVSDDDVRRALIELAEQYEALADDPPGKGED